MNYKKIVQIIPADGWKEVKWRNNGDTESELEIYMVPIVSWALVEHREDRKYGAFMGDDGEYYDHDIEAVLMDDNLYTPLLGVNYDTLGFWHSSMGDLSLEWSEKWYNDAVESWRDSTQKYRVKTS